jgi:DNA-binding NtrC family response regulator
MARILIVDDEAPIRASLKEILEYEGHKVDEAPDGKAGVASASSKPYDLIFCDVKMPGVDGIDVLELLRGRGVATPVVMISGHGTIETAVEAIRKGAFDFIPKPLDLNRILVTMRNALAQEALVRETVRLGRAAGENATGGIVGESPALREVLALVDQIAPTDARVMITGGNGTGKELIARRLHTLSRRAAGPFVEVNCAAIPSELIESELFGHEKGAFTSAVRQHRGKFEQAEGGTLFLDEIGDMGLSAQAKVLRVLQENRVSRVGGDKDFSVDVRVVAATNKDLRAEIAAGRFREDLFHRLAVIPLHIPDLNDRREDIPLLVAHFLRLVCESYGIPVPETTPDAHDLLRNANWTGNIRELRNVVERLAILTPRGAPIDPAIVQRYAGLGGG